ncbi:MAG: 6-carboxytetrahydropterin synthase QueD [Treponema sp.]|jgi:6-pyruvoyltetrahydropterin/6-carboxytetrahydropterin synthase|nr:6-carboxytetrahydropterin synthase QueD [Treponema sp.]
MFLVRVETEFAAAHFLSAYNGRCEQLHGHNYTVRVWLKGAELDADGILVDFSLIRQILKDTVAPLDHCNLNDNPSFSNNPSAERLAYYIFEKFYAALEAQNLQPELLCAVDVFENSGSLARYEI